MTPIFIILIWMTLYATDIECKKTTSSHHHDPTISHDPIIPMSTINPAFENFTIGPSIKVNYSMEVTTSGPAVFDSIMVFTARIFLQPNRTLPKGKFTYLWLNTADHQEFSTHGTHESQLRRTFGQGVSGARDFLMTVVVSPAKQPSDIVSFSSIIFRLTNRLNGNLKVTQSLKYQRSNTTFASDQPIRFHINITDHFNKSVTPRYTYHWYNGSDPMQTTSVPYLEWKFFHPTILHLNAVATAEFLSVAQVKKKKPAAINSKNGSFVEKLHFKESLRDCNISRVDSTTEDQSLKLGNSLVLNVSCHGSFPSAVCWNVTKLNQTLNETCRPGSHFVNSTQNTVTVTIGASGWKTVHLAVYNDISFQVLSQDFYVYDGDSVNIQVFVIPIVFIMLGLMVAAFGVTYIVRMRRKQHVEVADFDFDPSISVRSTGSWANIVPSVRQFFQRSRDRAMSFMDGRHAVSPLRGLYESL